MTDIYNDLDDQPATELRECLEVSEEERAMIEAFRGMTDEGRQVVWDLLKLATSRREAPDG